MDTRNLKITWKNGQIEFVKDSLGLESTKCYQIMLFF